MFQESTHEVSTGAAPRHGLVVARRVALRCRHGRCSFDRVGPCRGHRGAGRLYTRTQAVVQKAAEHCQSAPGLGFEVDAELGGGGYALMVTSKDRDLDSVKVTWIPGVDTVADQLVLGISGQPATPPAGALTRSATTPVTLPAGGVVRLDE
jgi:hypothetical protein